MYLSRVRVDLNGVSRKELFDVMSAHPYGMHRLLWRLFPDYEGPRPFLFRQEMEEGADRHKAQGLPLFYLLSKRSPVAIAGLLDVESKPFAPQLSQGDQLAFRMRANPTIDRRVQGNKRSSRSDVLMHVKAGFSPEKRATQECKDAMEAAARSWLVQQGQKKGFTVQGDPEISGYRQHVLEKNGRQGTAIKFSGVDYGGVLEVGDPGAFSSFLGEGAGRAKAFGFGLMMIRRAS